nr:uncharacterized family 31 glucosidase KIAA1161 [Onthophagus taurus]
MMLYIALFWAFTTVNSELISLVNNDVTLIIQDSDDGLTLTLLKDGIEKLSGNIGLSTNLENPTFCENTDNCINFGETILTIDETIENSFMLTWSTFDTEETFTDCFNLNAETTNWFGGPEQWNQYWPIEKLTLTNFANVPKENGFAAIVEPYWLNSNGAYIFVDRRTPLFIDQNSKRDDAVCFSAKVEAPFAPTRTRNLLRYSISARDNARDGHLHAVENFLGKPTGHPDRRIIKKPIWSTWARYKRPINDSILLQYANEIVYYEFPTGQFEIDDYWETCYGSLTFREPEFTNILDTVAQIKGLGFTVSLWVHPFVNIDCYQTDVGLANNYFIKNFEGSVLTSWWNSNTSEAQHVDFTNPEARQWFVDGLKILRWIYNIDAFKFDAGETSWAPQIPDLTGDVELSPSLLTETYVRMCAEFGELIEVRTGWGTQDLPVLVRMIDKDSRWGTNNGFRTLITTLLQMNINGYTMVLPDMVGGNGYIFKPSPELYIRWLQANTFMPTIQFSYVPWEFETDQYPIIQISKKFVEIHSIFADEIIRVMEKSVTDGYPVNPPIWWVDPLSSDALKEDTAYLLGEDILVAPVVVENAVTRDVYLPTGSWIDANTDEIYEGGQTLIDYPAPIEVLPYFIRSGSNAEKIYKTKVLKRA